MSITVENVEFYLLILVRMSAFIFTAPIFSIRSIPMSVKAAISVFLTMIVATLIPIETLSYTTVFGLAFLVFKEILVGLLIGFMASICTKIVSFSGQLLDMEIGFSMASAFDPINQSQVTVTGNLLTYLVMLTLLVTDLHYYLIRAIITTYRLIPVGKAIFPLGMYKIMVKFLVDFFVIGFRIILPVFAATLITNTVLGILAKVSPQLNMFVVGFQLKIFIGLLVLVVVVTMLPGITDYIMTEIKDMIEYTIRSLAGS